MRRGAWPDCSKGIALHSLLDALNTPPHTIWITRMRVVSAPSDNLELSLRPSDPIRSGRRKRCTMLDATITTLTGGTEATYVAAAAGIALRRKKDGQVVNAEADTDWPGLMVRVRDRRDREAFAALFRHFAPRIKGFLMKSGASATLAEECAQDVMATLWQKAHLFDPTRASVATWVFTIARNRRIDALRRARRAEPEDLPWGPEPEPDQAEVMEAQQETAQLGRALASLPEPQRALIERAFYGDLSHSEIAAETGLPLGTIKSRIRLALEKLRQQMT
jgi:RNA polymerase sigma-70 factor (ECF subfamily)